MRRHRHIRARILSAITARANGRIANPINPKFSHVDARFITLRTAKQIEIAPTRTIVNIEGRAGHHSPTLNEELRVDVVGLGRGLSLSGAA
jgi:hypothetical protein